jgi:hypothetical protein
VLELFYLALLKREERKWTEVYHTWSISSSDSSLAIGAKMFQFSLAASSIGWLNDENFEHLKHEKSFWKHFALEGLRSAYLNKLFSFAAAHSGCETDRWTFLDCNCCICAGGGSECGCFVLSVVVLKLSNEKSLCSDGWYDVAGLDGVKSGGKEEGKI